MKAKHALVKLVPGREFKPVIEPVHRCRHAGADKRRRLNDGGAGKATARVTIIQPKERHSGNVALGMPGWEGGKLSS